MEEEAVVRGGKKSKNQEQWAGRVIQLRGNSELGRLSLSKSSGKPEVLHVTLPFDSSTSPGNLALK